MANEQKNVLMLGAGLLLGVGLGILLLVGFVTLKGPGGRNSGGVRDGVALPAPVVGSPAPEFELNLLDGSRVNLKDFYGKPVLINFWATWCAPCELEMPAFESRYAARGGEFSILAINNAESREKVQQYASNLGLTFPIVLDPEGRVQRLYNIRGYPTSLLLDAEGVIRVYHIGLMSEAQLDKYLEDLGVGG
jgi:peroxiredoxin